MGCNIVIRPCSKNVCLVLDIQSSLLHGILIISQNHYYLEILQFKVGV